MPNKKAPMRPKISEKEGLNLSFKNKKRTISATNTAIQKKAGINMKPPAIFAQRRKTNGQIRICFFEFSRQFK